MVMFLAILESIWKRKEAKIFLAFAGYPLIYFVASFFGKSNFMQITVAEGAQIGYLDFADMMFNTLDAMMLPTLALCFLTISVFRREADDHTLFLYKDIDRQAIFRAKYLSLLLILLLYVGVFFLVTLLVHYTRVVQLPFGSSRLGADSLYNTYYALLNMFSIFLKGVLAITLATALSLRWRTGVTLGISIAWSLAAMIAGLIGGPVALLFPTGYLTLFQTLADLGGVLAGAVFLTVLYGTIGHYFGIKWFKELEF